MRRDATLAVRGMVLLAFAAFFFVPLAWLILAPTKTDYELLTGNPLRSEASTTSGTHGSAWTASATTSFAGGWRIRSSTR
jgi:hypothetical protein